MAARHFLNRGRSIRSSFGVSNIFAFNLLGGQFCKSTSHSNLLMLRSYATKSEAEKQNLKLGRIIKEGNRAYFHTTRLSSRSRKILPYLKRGDKMKLELKLNITRSNFLIHYIVPVEIKGKRVVRFYNDDHAFVEEWLPYTELMVKNQPADLRAVMDRYWLLPPNEGTSHDNMRAYLMLHNGVNNKLPLFDNYWEETVRIALPFFQENGDHYLGKILEDFPRGGYYDRNEFVKGLSRIIGKEVAVEYEDEVQREAVGLMFMFDEEKRLMNHPDYGTQCPRGPRISLLRRKLTLV